MRWTPIAKESSLRPETGKRRRQAAELMGPQLAARSPAVVRVVRHLFERALRKSFNSVRIANRPSQSTLEAPHLVIFSNHSSWWDGVLHLILGAHLLHDRPVYVPIDATMLQRYRLAPRVGAFGIEQASRAGALHFIEAARLILSNDRNVLFVTAQGRFADCRERPLGLQGGIAHLIDVVPRVLYLPLAVEAAFWLENRPELLLRFGDPVPADSLTSLPTPDRRRVLEAHLLRAMDDLSVASISRDSSAFSALLKGQRGINPFYDFWRRLRSFGRGARYHVGHGSEL